MDSMPKKSTLKLKPLKLGEESLGQRIARLRKERGWTQTQLAEKIGIIQTLVSEYERDNLRLHAEMVVRFAKVLKISTDELLYGSKSNTANGHKPKLKLLKRLNKIETLPPSQQKILLKTIDTFLTAAEK